MPGGNSEAANLTYMWDLPEDEQEEIWYESIPLPLRLSRISLFVFSVVYLVILPVLSFTYILKGTFFSYGAVYFLGPSIIYGLYRWLVLYRVKRDANVFHYVCFAFETLLLLNIPLLFLGIVLLKYFSMNIPIYYNCLGMSSLYGWFALRSYIGLLLIPGWSFFVMREVWDKRANLRVYIYSGVYIIALLIYGFIFAMSAPGCLIWPAWLVIAGGIIFLTRDAVSNEYRVLRKRFLGWNLGRTKQIQIEQEMGKEARTLLMNKYGLIIFSVVHLVVIPVVLIRSGVNVIAQGIPFFGFFEVLPVVTYGLMRWHNFYFIRPGAVAFHITSFVFEITLTIIQFLVLPHLLRAFTSSMSWLPFPSIGISLYYPIIIVCFLIIYVWNRLSVGEPRSDVAVQRVRTWTGIYLVILVLYIMGNLYKGFWF